MVKKKQQQQPWQQQTKEKKYFHPSKESIALYLDKTRAHLSLGLPLP